MDEYTAWLELKTISEEDLKGRKAFEDSLRKTIKEGNLDKISAQLTPRALTKCKSNALLMAMELNFELCRLANKKGPDEEEFTKLSGSLDEFISCLLDPLKTGGRIRDVFLKASIDDFMDAAIEFKQMKFFAHPVINDLMTEKWHGQLGGMKKCSWLSTERWTWVFLNIWCLLDSVLFPLLFIVFGGYQFIRKKIRKRKNGYINKSGMYGSYLKYFTTPYFVFVRDTLSLLVHLGLHFAICLAPSSISFTRLEWAIWIFYMGRVVMESKQLSGIKVLQQREVKENQPDKDLEAPDGSVEVLSEIPKTSIPIEQTPLFLKKFGKYLSDRWNVLDLATLFIYLIIFVLRMITWAVSQSVINNRTLVITGYLYGLNTIFHTFRTFGHVMETSRGVGSIQIALFHILEDVATIFWQFIAAILAFSIAITKVFVAEKSYLVKKDDDTSPACSTDGLSCWWTIARHLIWSLFGIVELDPLESIDKPSVTVGYALYGAFLIMGVILLINMMIALLSNTYTRVEDNSLKEWSFKKAIRIQTYSTYDPIPVPFNLISSLLSALRSLWRCLCCCLDRKNGNRNLAGRTQRSRLEEKMLQLNKESLDLAVKSLQVNYFASYGYTFPLTDKGKMDHLLQETNRIRPLTNQVAYNAFIAHGRGQYSLPTGPKAWESRGIRIEECLLMYEGAEFCQICKDHPTSSQSNHGARYLVPFSPEFPRFEVLILEAGERRSLEVGVTRKDYQFHLIRDQGWPNCCVGYHIKGDIFDADREDSIIEIEDAMAERGDLIGCEVLLEMAENGEVPISFTLNGKPITQARVSISIFQEDSLLFPFVSMGHEGVAVSAKMRPRDNADWVPSPVFTYIALSKSSTDTISEVEHDSTDVYHKLDYAGARFRRVRDDMLDNLRANFRRFEEVCSDWNKECLQMSGSLVQNNIPEGEIKKPALGKKINEAIEGLKEIEELGNKVNQKFGMVLKGLTKKHGCNY